MKTNSHVNRMFASAIEPLERRVCMSDAGTNTASTGVWVSNILSLRTLGGTDAIVLSDSQQGKLYITYNGTASGAMVLQTGSTIQFGQVTVTTGQGNLNFHVIRDVATARQPDNEPAPEPAAKKGNRAKRDAAPQVTADQQNQSESGSQVVLSTMPRTRIIEAGAGERGSRVSSVEAVMSKSDDAVARFIPSATGISTSSPMMSSTTTSTPLLQSSTVLGAAGTNVFAVAKRIAPVARAIQEMPAAVAAMPEVEALPEQTMAAVTNVLAAAPPRYFGYVPMNLSYTLLADSIAAFADRSASLSAAVVADARVGGPWALTAGVLAADVIALAYIHRRRLKARVTRVTSWSDALIA